MNTTFNFLSIPIRLWFFTTLLLAVAVGTFGLVTGAFSLELAGLVFVAGLVASLPVLAGLLIVVPFINRFALSWQGKVLRLLLAESFLCMPYGIATAMMGGIWARIGDFNSFQFVVELLRTWLLLFGCSLFATLFIIRICYSYFNDNTECSSNFSSLLQEFFSSNKNKTVMDTYPATEGATPQGNRILVKGLITGGLILLMLIPTLFIDNLVQEREARQKEVVQEVSSKWASAQTLSAPFLVVPYQVPFINEEGKNMLRKTNLILLAHDLTVGGTILPEERKRSIYKVLLYRSAISMAGSFQVKIPVDVNVNNIDFSQTKICFALSDFKGIEEEVSINYAGAQMLLSPGLPVNDFGTVGLSAPLALSAESLLGKNIPFDLKLKLRGSEQLHFMPMSGSSKFNMVSAWPSPSFDGDMLPASHKVSDSGFVANWSFNQANLPYALVFQSDAVKQGKMEFGVTLVQPADQYNKTMRSVKYAILFIGLTFALFFIIELMQKKPFHPVQYSLVGLALVIFYALLLSISEYIVFDFAYAIAALATVSLITVYAQAHFRSMKTALLFFMFLGILYGFIFVLIRLEDTALLVGSIGLFLVLALVMIASRRINWYGTNTTMVNAV